MGLYLIAETGTLQYLGNLLQVILMVAGGLGFVIFVHELGHFLVAKACGVKCEKFYLGFDIAGLKLFKFQWGETEYGIGILPLGGYVKMLGQDDNPSGEAADVARAQSEPLDPRSYKAQSVPERMAIISAGVIMNLIFACLMAAVAYSIGIKEEPCVISGTMPGEAAWQADMHPGDKIIQIGDRVPGPDEQLRFRDLRQAAVFSSAEDGVRFKIERQGVAEPFWVTLRPQRAEDQLAPMIGALGPQIPTLAAASETATPVRKSTPTAKLDFKSSDRITAIDGQPVANFADLLRLLAQHPDDEIGVTVARPDLDKDGKPTDSSTILEIRVPPNPLKTLGLVMQLGPITAIAQNSPAAEAGLKPGDQILTIDGEPTGDPATLPERLRRKAGTAVELAVERKGSGGKLETITKTITLAQTQWWEESRLPSSPLAITALGVACKVPSVIAAIEPDSPAAKAELKGKDAKEPAPLAAGMEIAAVEFIPPPKAKSDKASKDDDDVVVEAKPIKIGDIEGIDWPCFINLLQYQKPGTKIRLTLADKRTAELEPVDSNQWNNPDRGFVFKPEKIDIQAHGPSQALSMGVRETRDSVGQVYGFLRRIGTRISPLGLGGPITIAREAGHQAGKGLPELLIFLTMLSANLAVINFLPIPILDGGHMVFLLLEGIFRRPVNERVVVAFHYAGFLFIISLMLFVIGLDIGLIPRR